MTGKLYIDGEDACHYGIEVDNGGYSGLAALPPLKKLDSNDWHEDDGVEVDLSSPALDTLEIQVKLTAHIDVDSFMSVLADGAYHTFDFREVGRVCRLRLVSQVSLKTKRGLHKLTLQLANDFPLEGYTYAAPQSSLRLPASGYAIDDVDLAEYGISVLQGSLSEVLKSAPVKKNLLLSVGAKSGALYDDVSVTFQQKDVTLKCLMQAATMSELWRNRDALLYDLSRADSRTLYTRELDEEYLCYYKSSAVERFLTAGKIWFTFSLTLVATSPKVDVTMLTSNDGAPIVTYGGKFIAIETDFLVDKYGILIATDSGKDIELKL